jgi:hypothetical protein
MQYSNIHIAKFALSLFLALFFLVSGHDLSTYAMAIFAVEAPSQDSDLFQKTSNIDGRINLPDSDNRLISKAVVTDFNILTPAVNKFDKFEAEFKVDTIAENPFFIYDANPPAGLDEDIGVTVDVLFTPDNWITTIIQPAFYYQPYDFTARESRDHFVPSGPACFMVRFTPQIAGDWQLRVRIEDASGISYYPGENQSISFKVGSQPSSLYKSRGFLKVSPTDPRYFEFQNGSPFIGVGFNDSFNGTTEVAEKMKSYEWYKMNFMRVWMSGSGINGSHWTSWASHHLSGDGYLPGVNFDTSITYDGGDVSLRLDDNNPCLFTEFWQGGVPVVPNTSYTVWARVRLEGVDRPANSGDYGFVIKQGDWLEMDCTKPDTGKPITELINGSTGWVTVTGTYRTGPEQLWLDYLYLTLQNASAGKVYIDEVRLYQTDDPVKVNILREPYANSHMYFDPMNSAQWDQYIQLAEQHGVYLKIVIDEKNEWIRNRLGEDGRMTPQGSNDNFYAAQNTKGRWLQEAWWRYLVARWGYSTAIHSFEYVNEGDPYNGRHYEAANAFARYVHQNDPSGHMVTTSFWSSFPNKEFWSNPQYSDIDYANIHAYISTGWGVRANLLNDTRVETNPFYIRSGTGSARLAGADNGSQSITPRGVVIQGAGEWVLRYYMKAQSFTANCPHGSSGGMQRVTWKLDGGSYWGGKEGIVPFNQSGQTFICTSPSGTFNWREFRSDRDRNGDPLPRDFRLILNDDLPHEITIGIENSNGTGGTAWIDDIVLISPSGEVVDVLGHFETIAMDEDTAWYNYAYGSLWGGKSLAGAGKPLVRGETGVDFPDRQEWNTDLTNDKKGVFLHNNVWGQINPHGMYDLFWWVKETIPPNIYSNYLTYRNFMEGIPLSNGFYRDAKASTSSPRLRAWGQRDDFHGQMHLWIQNMEHTWKNMVAGTPISPVSGSLTLHEVPVGRYAVEWWNTYTEDEPVFHTETITSDGSLILNLPTEVSDDIAVKIKRLP